ncbi:hypothetical protein BJ138DRAFT_1176321 [Hygrophoropsis aurantiaca]|uniref:Uncharacterized protein n=1 Tax=Hygrophoropsis aurantiaca TaxID=72124 RepID=A0ACB8AR57_9AGAM|nr:hypothetical protein BJ138DRAFT_1176321 [Hygrophoropsis aurantiaca]
MHRCLLILEIVQSILSMIGQPKDERGRSRDPEELQEMQQCAAQIARTCRALYDPAMDILYRELLTIEPLIKCLPRDLWKIDSVNQVLIFCRALTPDDFALLQRNAFRVRILGDPNIASDIDYTLGDVSYGVLNECHYNYCQDAPFCPSLRELTWTEDRQGYNRFIELFLGQNLDKLFLMGRWTRALGDYPFHVKSPFVKTFNSTALDGGSNNIFLDAISHWRTLEVLATRMPPNEGMHYIASSSSLKRLDIFLFPSNFEYSPAQFTARLSTLKLLALAFPVFATFLNCFSLSTRQVDLRSLEIPLAIQAQTSFELLSSRLDRGDLHKINIGLGQDYTTQQCEDPAFIFDFGTISPLLSFTALRVLNLGMCLASNIDDEALREMASSWPNLEEIMLGTNHGNTIVPAPRSTHRGFLHLLERCRFLRTLEMAFDTTGVGPDQSTSHWPSKSLNTKITLLVVGNSPIQDPVAVRAFLSTVIPSLVGIFVPPTKNDLEADVNRLNMWKEVSIYLS